MTRSSSPGPRRAGIALCSLALGFILSACDAPDLDRTDLAAQPGPPVAASPLTSADGYVPLGAPIDPFDDHPTIENLEPALRDAIRQAALDARAAGVEILVTSGWRSHRYQQHLLDEAVVTYGSESEARRWVHTPDASKHVTGEAVDVGPTDAASWLSQRGADYGLCQIYANEMWHYELVIEPGGTCPRQYTDASER